MGNSTLVGITIAVSIGVIAYSLRGLANQLLRAKLQSAGSSLCGTRVTIAQVAISPIAGCCVISGLCIANPSGFKRTSAVQIDQIAVELNLFQLFRDLVPVQRIICLAADIDVERRDRSTNLMVIRGNMVTNYASGAITSRKRFIVDAFAATQVKVHLSAALMNGNAVTLPLPDVRLSDIGKDAGGVTPGELGKTVIRAVTLEFSRSYGVGQAIKATGKVTGKLAQLTADLLKTLLG